jgi:hypothetical protein
MSAKESARSTVRRLLDVVLQEIETNSAFAARIEAVLAQPPQPEAKRSNRRPPAVLDPFAVFAERGDSGLRTALASLSVEQLKDIVAQHGMDRTKLAMKWKTPDRLIDLVVETVEARSKKGDAFR